MGAGGAEGAIDASNMLKPALARGELQCIGATTLDEYRKYIEKDGALERRFQPIMVDPPTVDETIQIILGPARQVRGAPPRQVSPTTPCSAAVMLSDRYIHERFLPDKAIDVIDEAGARARLVHVGHAPTELRELEQRDRGGRQARRRRPSSSQEFEKAARLRDREKELRAKLRRDRRRTGPRQARDAGDRGRATTSPRSSRR